MRGLRKFKGPLLAAIAATILLFAVMPLAASFAETITYTYDATNQLKQEQYAGGFAVTYDYDGMGNMQQMAASNTDSTAPSAPIIASPTNGGVVTASSVTLSGTAEALSTVKVYNGAMLLGGTTADASGVWFYTTILLPDGNYSVTATATDAAGNVSGASTLVTVTIQTTAPTTTASPMGGTYNSAQSVTLTCFDGTGSGCDKIYYTTDGTTPTTASNVFSAPISISSTTTLNYFASDLSGHSEPVKSQTYTFETTPPVTTASPVGGAFNSTRVVALTCSDDSGSGCARIYYTTDGTTPTTASSVYTVAITISATATLKYFAVDLAGNSETVQSHTYLIETTPPVTTASLVGGTFYSTQTVTLTCSDGTGSGCDKIYYTTDGSEPTTSSSVYTGAISIASTTTLKYFATDKAGNSEAVKNQTYTIDITQCYWTNAAGGNWSTPTNWSCGHAPTSTDYAFITLNGTYTVTLDTNATVNSLTLGGSTGTQTFSASNRTLTINIAATIGGHGSMSLSGSTVSGAGNITNSGMLDLSYSTINTTLLNGGTLNVYGTSAIAGALTTQSGSLLHVEASAAGSNSYPSVLTVASGFTNNGTIEIVTQGSPSSVSSMLKVTSGALVNAPGGVINSFAGGYGTHNMEAEVNNQGTITVGYPLTIEKASATHANSGTINVNADLTIRQWTSSHSFTNNGIISIASGKTLSVSGGGTFNQNAGATISGAGTLSLNYLTANLQTAVDVGTLSLYSTTANLTSDIDLGTMNLNLGNATLNGPVTITVPSGKTLGLSYSTLNTALVNGGTVNVYGTSVVNGALTTQSGSLLHVEASASSNSYPTLLTVANGFTNNGTIEIVAQGGSSSVSAIVRVTSGTLVNAPGGVINSLAGGGYGTRNIEAVVNNQGTMTVGYPLTIEKASAAHVSSGTIAVDANLTVSLYGTSPSFTNSGVISIASGKTISVSNGTFNQNVGAMLGGGGTLSLSGLTANLQTTLGVSALSLSSTTANLTSDIDLGTMALGLSNATVNGPVTITNPVGKTFLINNSTVNTTLINGGTLNAYGTSAINGALTTQAGSLLHVESPCSSGGSSILTVANGFTNTGTIELINSCGTGYTVRLTVSSGTLLNAPGGVISSLVGSSSGSRELYTAVDNQGTITVSYPLTIEKISSVHTNSGTINANGNLTVTQWGTSPSFTNTGVISIASGKTMSVSGGTFNNTSSAILSGSGTINVSGTTFTQNGTINPGSSLGKLSITGPLPQTATSVVNMEIGGTTAGITYDQLAISGAATLNGMLNVNLVNGFTPNTGDSFTLMTYASKPGAFSTVNLPPMGKLWNAAYNPTSLVLSVGGVCPSITLSPASLPAGTVGTPFSQSISASGGTGSYTYTLTSGSLPSGLALSSDGILSGTPTAAGTYTFTVTGTDATTCTGSVQYTMTVQTTCVAPPSGLVSWWQGEGDANDQMNRNTGSLMNGTTFAPGKVGQAFSLDGVDDMVQAGTVDLPTGDGDRTVALWVNITQPVATDSVFAGYGTPGVNDQLYMLGATGSDNTLFFSNGTDTLSGPNLQSGRWYHVAVTNSGNLATLYLDGAVVATDTLTLSTPTNSAFFVGYLDADRKLNGAVDEVQVFNRTLSATEIADIYNAGSKGVCDTVAPTVLAASPANGATNAAITAPITVTLSEAMDATTMNAANFTVNGGVTGTVTYDAGTKTATFIPSANLAYSMTYTATITAGVKDLAGNALAADYLWNFATEAAPDTIAPTTTASPMSGIFNATQSVTLICSDGDGSGCDKIYYTNDGSTPTTSSSVYTAPISITADTTLQYFATDLAGNSETVKSQAYTIDTTAPTTTTSPGTTAFNGTLSVTLTCSDGTGSGCSKTYYTTNGTTPTTASTVYTAAISISATTTLKFFSTDVVGNSEAVKSATYTLDTTAPTGTISINAAATNATTPSVTLTLTCTDTNGCSQMQFSNDNTTWSTAEAYATSKAWTLSAGDGTKTVYAKFKDTAGNWSTVYNDTIILDANAPTTTALPAGGVYNANKSVTLTCADGTGTGCNKIYYTTNGTTPTTASTAYSRAISITATTTLKYFATDKAGNSEVVKSQTYTIDKTAPAGSIIINGGAASTNNFSAALTLTCTDANGCSQMQFSNDNKTWSAAEAYATTKTWTMTTGVGTKTVYVKFRDTAGNLSTAYKDTISLAASSDLTARAVSAPTSANITEPVNVTVTIANQSGDAGNFSVGVYLSTDAAITTGDTYVGSITYTGTVSAGAQATVSTTVRVPSSPAAGTYYIGAIVDPPVTGYTSGYVAESNETNNALAGNAMTVTAVSPDLTITTVSGPASGNINEVVTASATVKNQGGNTGGFNVYLYLSTDTAIATTDTWLGSGTVNSLAAGAQTTINVAGKVPSTMTAGNYYIGAIVDPPVTGYPSGYVTESNEANNALAGNLMAVTTTAPDLTVATVSGPTSANITEPLAVQALIKNQGGSVGGFYVSAYLSTDTIITTGDSYLGSFWYDTTLSAGAQTTVNIPASIPATVAGGNYYVGVIVDPPVTGYPSGYVVESSETNNALAGNSMTVTATLPDLTVTSVSGPTTGTKGQPITVSTTTNNQGGSTGEFHVGVYLSTDATITKGDTFLGYYGPVSSLAGGTSTTIGGPLTIPATLAAGTYYIGAIADYNDVVVELSGTNNALTGNQITITP